MATTNSFSPSSSVDESTITEEVELLEAIYINELTLEKDDCGRPTLISLLLHPATGENVDEQFVCLTLEFRPSQQYPQVAPDITIRNPRGLADEHVQELRESLNDLSEDRTGGPMLYELIELAIESLTQGNTPHGQCVICLEHFSADDLFTKTECYHYFHCGCLVRYIHHCQQEQEAEEQEARRNRIELPEKKIGCPLCRETITYDLEALEQSSEQLLGNEEKYSLSKDIREMQKKMATLFEEQKAKGGIIDLEFEKNKFLLPTAPLNVENTCGMDAVRAVETIQQIPPVMTPISVKAEPRPQNSSRERSYKNDNHSRESNRSGNREEGKRKDRDRWGRGRRGGINHRDGRSWRENQVKETLAGADSGFQREEGSRRGRGRGYRGARRGDGSTFHAPPGGSKEVNPYRDKRGIGGTHVQTVDKSSHSSSQQQGANGHSNLNKQSSASKSRGNTDSHHSSDTVEFNLYKNCSENSTVERSSSHGEILSPIEDGNPSRRVPPGFRARGPPPGFNCGSRKSKPSSIRPELQEDR